MLEYLINLLPPFSVKTVVTCLIWYLVSSVTSQLTKLILIKFTYPLFLSQFQFMMGAVLSLSFITLVKAFPQLAHSFPPGSVPVDPSVATFRKSVLIKILPLGLFQFVGKFFSLSATSLVPLATMSSIKALSPLLIVSGYRIVYKVKFPIITYLSLTPLVAGVILMIWSDSLKMSDSSNSNSRIFTSEFDYSQIKGLVFCSLSTIIFASQNIYGKQLITWDSNTTNPASLVLNTEISRPNTPCRFDWNGDQLEKKQSELNNSSHKPINYIRQRTYSIKLPYSTSDLRLDDKNEEINRNNQHYSQVVDENNTNISNPFTSVLNYEATEKPDKLTIILYCSLIGFLFSITGFVINELPEIINGVSDAKHFRGSAESASDIIVVLLLIAIDSLSHFLQTILAFHLLGSIPTLSYSIASMMKRIVLITVGILVVFDKKLEYNESKWFGRITTEQFCGLFLIAIGLYSYDRWGSRSLKGHV